MKLLGIVAFAFTVMVCGERISVTGALMGENTSAVTVMLVT